MPAGCFDHGKMLVSGQVGFAEENIEPCPLHLGSSMKLGIGLIIPIYFVWAYN